METKYTTVPFDIERAKRIANGEEPGKIITEQTKHLIETISNQEE